MQRTGILSSLLKLLLTLAVTIGGFGLREACAQTSTGTITGTVSDPPGQLSYRRIS